MLSGSATVPTFRVTRIVKHSALSLLDVCQSRVIAIAVQDVPLGISFARPLPFVDGRSGLVLAVVRVLSSDAGALTSPKLLHYHVLRTLILTHVIS
jgi:hypothetical protein